KPTTNTQFLTGIAYNDSDADKFYSINEGRAGVTVTTTAGSVSTASAGNYSKEISAGVQTISFSGGGLPTSISAEITVTAGRNALVNLVDTSTLETSVSLKAISGVVKIIGLGNIGLTLTGNALDNTIVSALGSDTINGADGTDTVVYSGLRASYVINTNVATGITTVTGFGATDTLSLVEKLQFSDQFITIGGPANRAPTVAVADKALNIGQAANIASWVAYSDPDGNPATQFQLIDNGAAANSGVLLAPNGSVVAAGTTLSVSAADLANVLIRGGTAAGTETVQIRAFDGTTWSAWDSFNFTTNPPANRAPTVAVGDKTLAANAAVKIASWVSYSDPDGNPATQFQLIDNGTAANSGVLLAPNGNVVAAGTTLSVSAADLANVSIRGGTAAGTETMQIRAFDGTAWSAWDSFNITTTAPLNRAPVVTIDDKTLKVNLWGQVTDWLKYSDADGNAAVQYQFIDKFAATGSAYFWNNGVTPVANQVFTVNAADIGNVWVRGATVGGWDNMEVRAFDGTSWSAWDSFKVTTLPNNAPVALIADKTVKLNQWVNIADLIGYSDKDGDAAVQYQFNDLYAGNGSAYLWFNGAKVANQAFTVNAADLGNVWVRGAAGTGWDNMQVRASDGMSWGAWDTFKVTTVANSAPVATINDTTQSKNLWVQVSTLVKATDANGDAITEFQFVDQYAGAGSAYFYTPDKPQHAANEIITVKAADIGNVWIRAGQGAGWDNMLVRASDGTAWGTWDSFKFITLNNVAPVVSAQDIDLRIGQKVAAKSLFSVIDGDAGDAMTQYQFYDDTAGANSGYFDLNKTALAADTTITVSASDLGKLSYNAGSAVGTDMLWARAFDGDLWSAWHQFDANTII
ncbi:MAG: hypothetical protein AB7V13_14400, partial [Pseudorhodoplanes sp.]